MKHLHMISKITLTVILLINRSLSLLMHQYNMKRLHGIGSNIISNTSTSRSSMLSSLKSNDNNNEFYKRLGEPKYVTAPMVAQSDIAFRLLTKKYGSQLCYTQMIHSNNFIKSADFRKNHLDVYTPGTIVEAVPSQLQALGKSVSDKHHIQYGIDNDHDVEDCVMIQLAGNNGNVMKEAAMRIMERLEGNCNDINSKIIAGIDVNLGCPQNIAKKGNYGAHLFTYDEDGTQVCNILSSLNDVLPDHIGLSAKIRLLPNLDELPNRIQMMLDAARLDILTIHGRTIKENKTKNKHANWDAIHQIKQAFPNLPIFANGGIEYTSDLQRCLLHTKANGIMSSEALLENPGLFNNNNDNDDTNLSPSEILQRQINYALTYLNLTLKYPPLPVSLGKKGGSFSVVRSHLFKILYRYLEENIDLRNALADSSVTHTIPQAIILVHTLLERYDSISDEELLQNYKSSNLNSSWYRRHRIDDGRFIHQRNYDIVSNTNNNNLIQNRSTIMTMDEKKELIKKRIKKMKDLKQQKVKSVANFI